MPPRGNRGANDEQANAAYLAVCKHSVVTRPTNVSHLQAVLDANDEVAGITRDVVDTLMCAVNDLLVLRPRLQKTLYFQEAQYELRQESARVLDLFGQAVRREFRSSVGQVRLKAPVLLYFFILMGKYRGSLHPHLLHQLDGWQDMTADALLQNDPLLGDKKAVKHKISELWVEWGKASIRSGEPQAQKQRKERSKVRKILLLKMDLLKEGQVSAWLALLRDSNHGALPFHSNVEMIVTALLSMLRSNFGWDELVSVGFRSPPGRIFLRRPGVHRCQPRRASLQDWRATPRVQPTPRLVQ